MPQPTFTRCTESIHFGASFFYRAEFDRSPLLQVAHSDALQQATQNCRKQLVNSLSDIHCNLPAS